MYTDLILMDKTADLEALAKSLSFSRIFFKDDFKKLKIEKAININKNRELIEYKRIRILLNPQDNNSKDTLKEKSIGLNHIILELARKNKIMIGLSLDQFSNIQSLGRITAIIQLCRKYKVKICVFSLAKAQHELKSAYDIISLLKITGMTPGEAKTALNNVLTALK